MGYNPSVQEMLAERGRKQQVWFDNLDRKNNNGENVYVGHVTGLTHYRYSQYINYISCNTQARVVPDPANQYDSNAVRLEIYVGQRWHQIGWIPKGLNAPAALALKRGVKLHAAIHKHDPDSADYQQRLFISVAINAEAPRPIDDYTPVIAIPKGLIDPAAIPTSTEKESTMAIATSKIIDTNVNYATNAAFLEAGRIATKQLSKVAASKLPLMARGYADTPLGRLVLANIAQLAAEHFRADDQKIKRLTQAMIVTAYQEVLQQFDVEEFIDDILSNNTIKKALKNVDDATA